MEEEVFHADAPVGSRRKRAVAMQLMLEIPDSFWSLFRSVNRNIYIDALLTINEEYQYNNYFLSWEVCVQVLGNYFNQKRISIIQEAEESETDLLEPPATRTLRWLTGAGWLKRRDDYAEGVTHIIIPDYAAVMIEAFETLYSENEEDTDIYIQGVYAILFSYRNDKRQDAGLLNTALANTKKLNKVLQSMLHNMDKFFASLLNQDVYGDLLKEHLDRYVEEIVKKKYHILKTTDNFYQYKMDIKNWLKELAEEENQKLYRMESAMTEYESEEEAERDRKKSIRALGILEEIDRGFLDIERRIFNMDKEHTKYVRATVARLNYLLNQDKDRKGLLVKLMNAMAGLEDQEEAVKMVAGELNFSRLQIFSDKAFYKKRKSRTPFTECLEPEPEPEKLDREEVLKLNKIRARYSQKQIERFIEDRMKDGSCQVGGETVLNDEDFEQLILAYDYCIRRDSKYLVMESGGEIRNGRYRYPALTFIRRG